VIEALNAATTNLDQSADYRQQPKLEASLRLAVGRTDYTLACWVRPERNLRLAAKLGRSAHGPQHLDTLAAQHWVGEKTMSGKVTHHQGDVLTPVEHGAEAVRLELAVFGWQPAAGLELHQALGAMSVGDQLGHRHDRQPVLGGKGAQPRPACDRAVVVDDFADHGDRR